MSYYNIIFYLILFFLSSNTRIHVIALIAYKCLIVSKQIQNIIDNDHRIQNISIKAQNMRILYQVRIQNLQIS